MKNSRPYVGDAFQFYKRVCDKKQGVALKARLLMMDADIQNLFAAYDRNFQANTLENLISNGFLNQEKEDLEELYDYQSATLAKLRDSLTTTNTGRVVKCQNCTINDISTFDHQVPQGDFAEFIVHPRNLLCCCGDCNSRRNNIWRQGGRRTTLNLYLDNLPDLQYLFVSADIGNSATETTFYLENRNGVDDVLFELLQNHYTRLNLFDRFSFSADTVITSLKNILEPLRDFHNLPVARDIALRYVAKERAAFGFNYWQSVLKMELLKSDDFMNDFE